MKRGILTVVFLILLLAGDAWSMKKGAPTFSGLAICQRVAECVADLGPRVADVDKKALDYARLNTSDLDRWKKRIRYSALLPRLQFGYERRSTDSIDLGVDDSVSVTSAGINVGPSVSNWGRGYDTNNNIKITAVWYLDELLFNRDDLSISSEVRSQISARRELLGDITDDYFELKRLVSIYLCRSDDSKRFRGEIRLRIGRLIGRLDMATGGWFGKVFKWKGAGCE